MEYIAKISKVENVMEFDSGWQEDLGHSSVQCDRALDQLRSHLLYGCREVARSHEVLLQDGAVDGLERVLSGKAQCEDAEVSLQSRVDGEAACSRVHAGDVLHVVNLLERQLHSVVPVIVVYVLPQQRVRLHCEVLVHFGHVQVVDEVDQFLRAWRAELSSLRKIRQVL